MSDITPEYKPMYEQDVGYEHPINENNLQKIGANQNYYKDSCDARQAADTAQLAQVNAWFARDIRMFANSHGARTVSFAVDGVKRYFAMPFLLNDHIDLAVFSCYDALNFAFLEGINPIPYNPDAENTGIVLKSGITSSGMMIEVLKVGNRS